YFDQQEIRRTVGSYSDLYAAPRTGGRARRLTSEDRLIDPDLSPDGTTLVCVQDKPGQRNLVLAGPLDAPAPLKIPTLVAEDESQFNTPRWSPDGRRIAVERHRKGRLSEIALVDVESRQVTVVASEEGTRFVTPAWRPDGRALVVAAAPQDLPFNLYE